MLCIYYVTLGNMHAPWETPGKSCCLPIPVNPPKGGSGEGDVVFPPVKPPKGGSGEEEVVETSYVYSITLANSARPRDSLYIM